MDIGALKADFRKCLDTLPPGMVNPAAVGKWLAAHRPALEKLIPDILERMKPHVMAGMLEASIGAIDTDEIEKACIDVLLSYGVQVADGG